MILKEISNILPIIVRRMNLEKIKKFPYGLQTDLINRIILDVKSAELKGETLTLTSRVVTKVITLLPTDPLSDICKNILIEKLRQDPNLGSLDDILPRLHAYQSDDVARKVSNKRKKLNAVKEDIKCRICQKKHPKRSVDIVANTAT